MSSLRASTPFKNLALAVASTVVFAGGLESVARFLEPPPVQKEEYLWDWSERFKDGDFYTLEKGEGYPPSEETNVDGLRDVTRPVETREGLRRIVILGDSVAYGHGVEAAEAFPQILERIVRPAGRDVDVFNVALPGWSTRQERIAYERIASKYKPDVVVLAVCLNDLAELQINLAKPPGFLLALFKHSATVRLALGASKREIGAVEELFTAPDSERVKNAFRLFFEEARGLRELVTRDGAAFHLVVFPFRFQVEAGAPDPSVQSRISEFARAESIPFHDFLPEIATSEEPSRLFLDYDHFNPRGHDGVAAWLAGIEGIVSSGTLAVAGSSAGGDRALPAGQTLEVLQGAASATAREQVLRGIREAAAAFAYGSPAMAPLGAAAVEMAVDDLSPRVRFEAAQAVFDLGLPTASSVEPLIRGVRHEDPRVRAFATWTLGEMGAIARPAMPALVALARKDGGAGRTGALTAMGKIGGDSKDAVPLLIDELGHSKANRRYRAARTIGRMGVAAAGAVPALVEALHDPSPLVRLEVVRALGEMGDAAKPAVTALIEILNADPDGEVRKEVSLTLSKLPGR